MNCNGLTKVLKFAHYDKDYNGLTAPEIAKNDGYKSIVELFNAREESLIAKNQAILEMLYISKRHLPKEMRVLIAQTMNLIWRDQLQLLQINLKN